MTEMTPYESWWFSAAFLPVVVGFIIQRDWSTRAQAATAVAVYVAYGLVGSLISGQLDGLAWDSVGNVLTSIVAVAMIGYSSYQTLWRAFPLPQFIEEKTGGDPMVEVIPGRNVT